MKKLLLLALAIFLISKISAQNSVEATIGYGATAIDLDAVVDKDEVPRTSIEDWSVENIGFSFQYVKVVSNGIGIGGEIMYQHLYWYSVKVPFAGYREYSVNTLRLTPMLRLGVSAPACLDLGLSFNFMDPLRLGLMASGNYYLTVNEQMDIPFKLRLDYFKNIEPALAVSFNVGIRIKLNSPNE